MMQLFLKRCFEKNLYNDERKIEDRELLDETDPNEYEDKSEQFERYEDGRILIKMLLMNLNLELGMV